MNHNHHRCNSAITNCLALDNAKLFFKFIFCFGGGRLNAIINYVSMGALGEPEKSYTHKYTSMYKYADVRPNTPAEMYAPAIQNRNHDNGIVTKNQQ